MRIVYYSTPSFADSDLPLVKALMEAGHEVFYILRIAPFSRKSPLIDIASLQNVIDVLPAETYPELSRILEYLGTGNVFVANDPVGKTRWSSIRLLKKQISFIRALKPDVFHHVETPSWFNLYLLARVKARRVCTIHDPYPHTGERKLREHYARLFSRFIFHRFILLNDRQTDIFCSTYHIPKKKLAFARLGSYDYLSDMPSKNSQSGKYVLLFGRIQPYKGVEYAIRAMRMIHSNYPDVKLLIAGSGNIYFDAKEYEGLPFIDIQNRFIPIEELASLVKGALFSVCPYTDATQSGVVQTAFALDCPLIVTDVGALGVAIENMKTGIVVPPCDTDALATAMNTLLSNQQLLDEMRATISSRRQSGRDSWTEIAKNYLEAYEND